MNPCEFFSENYQSAREKFLAACETADASVESYRNSHTGAYDPPLHTDVCTLGVQDASMVLVIGSGTHGVEGFAGSGIQTGLIADGLGSRLPRDVKVVMIHAINPFGFAHLRRVNEDNVDLNRNFVDHSTPHPKNNDYDRLAHAIAPVSMTPITQVLTISKMVLYRLLRGKKALQYAVSRGQYTHQNGLFYGGQEETWSNRTLQTIIQGLGQSTDRLALVDIHTGLGDYGYGEIIMNEPKTSSAYQRAIKWWGEGVKSTKESDSVSEDLEGTMKLAVSRILPDAEVTATGLEFGTYPTQEVFLAMRMENWLHHHGGKSHPRAAEIKARFRRAFYPEADDWKLMIWEQANEVVSQALDGIASR